MHLYIVTSMRVYYRAQIMPFANSETPKSDQHKSISDPCLHDASKTNAKNYDAIKARAKNVYCAQANKFVLMPWCESTLLANRTKSKCRKAATLTPRCTWK